MKIILSILLITLGSLSFVWGNNTDSVRSYYQLKNKAELAIVDSNYRQALEDYKAAFKFKFPNARDLYNTFVLAYILKDSSTAKSCFNLMTLYGQTKEKLEELGLGNRVKNEDFYKWVSNDYESIRQKGLSSSMPKMASVMDSIFQIDQKVRGNMLNRKLTEQEREQIVKVDSSNVAYIKSIIHQYGFPGYKKSGIYEQIYQGWPHPPSTIWLVMWHTRNLLDSGLNKMVYKEVAEGNFPPDEYAIIIDNQNKDKTYYEVFYKDIESRDITFKPVPDEEKVNKNRAGIYLEPIEDYKKKLYYEQKGGHPFYLVTPWALALNFVPINFEAE